MKTRLTLLLLLIIMMEIVSCKKFLEKKPLLAIGPEMIFSSEASAEGAIVGLYTQMTASFCLTNGYIPRYMSEYGDELVPQLPINSDHAFYKNTVSATEPVITEMWSKAYNLIYHANQIIENLKLSKGMNDQGKQRLIHEAKFVRAFVYYLLINLFGEVPLVVSSDYTVNQTLGKTSVPLLYSFLVADLLSAAEYLPLQYATYPLTGSSPIRATKFAAMMLLSRIYLLQENWSMADHYCSQVLLSNKFMLEPVTKTFALNSREAIWTLQPVSGTYNTAEGYYFNTGLSAQRPAYLLSNELAGSFDTTDARFKAWLRPLVLNGKTFYTSNKYKVYKSEQLLEVNTVFRLAEAYLIRAEARLHTNRVAEAITDLNIIRSRANLFPLSNDLSSQQLLFAVEQERKLEYFMEWGMRFFDLKRWASQHTNSRLPLTRADDVLSALVKGVWQSYKLLLPIPDGEIRKLPNVTQNTGY